MLDKTWDLFASRIGSATFKEETHKLSEFMSVWFTTLVRVLNLVLAVPLIVMGEMYISGLGGEERIPTAEGIQTVGQWAAPMGAGFLVTAAIFSRYLESKSALGDIEETVPEMASGDGE